MTATIEMPGPPGLEAMAPDASFAYPGPPPSTVVARSRSESVARSIGLGAIGFAVLITVWALVSVWKPDVPSPLATLRQTDDVFRDPFHDGMGNDKGIGIQLRGSLGRVFKGFGLAALIGIPFGLAVGASRSAWQAANPVIQLLRPISPLAWFPIFLTMFRNAPQAAMWTIFMTSVWPTVINTAAGAASVPIDQQNVAQVFKFSRLSYLRHVLVPHTLPSIVTGLRLSMGIAWMVIVGVEMLSGGIGIGFFVWDSYNALNLAKVICAIGLIGVVGLLLDAAFLRLGRLVAPAEVRS